MITKSWLLAAAAVSLTVIGLGACSSSTPGIAQSTVNHQSSASAASDLSTKSMNPCEVLSGEVAGTPLGPGTPDNTHVGSRGCDYPFGDTHGDGVSIGFWDTKGLDELNFSGEDVTPITIGGRQGKEDHDYFGPGTCLVALPVGPHSTAEALYGGRSSDPACQVAEAVAKVMASKLPVEN